MNNIPFEKRASRPNRQPAKRDELTPGDRLVCAFFARPVLGGVLWTFGYVILMYVLTRTAVRQLAAMNGGADPWDSLPPFWWGGLLALGFAAFGAVVGAERMMDCFQRIFHGVSKVWRTLSDPLHGD